MFSWLELMSNYLIFWPTILSIKRLVQCLTWVFVCLIVTFCIVAIRHVLLKNCLKEFIGNQGQQVDFWVAVIFLQPVSPLRPPKRPFLLYLNFNLLIINFTHDSIYATARIWHGNSVCPSVRVSHVWIIQKQLKLGKCNFHCTVASCI